MIRVLVVDDHPLVRQGLTAVLAAVDGIEVVDTVSEGAGAAQAAVNSAVDVVLMDLSLPGMDGVEATRQVLIRCPQVRVVVLASFAEHSRVTSALRAGAVGYLLKDTEPDDLVQAIREAHPGSPPSRPERRWPCCRRGPAQLPSPEAS